MRNTKKRKTFPRPTDGFSNFEYTVEIAQSLRFKPWVEIESFS